MNKISGDIAFVQLSDVESEVIHAGSESQNDTCEQTPFCMDLLQTAMQQELHHRNTQDYQLLKLEDLSAPGSAYAEAQQGPVDETNILTPLMANSPAHPAGTGIYSLNKDAVYIGNDQGSLTRLGVFEKAGQDYSSASSVDALWNYKSAPSSADKAAEMAGLRQQLPDVNDIYQLLTQAKLDGPINTSMIRQAHTDNRSPVVATDFEHSSLASVMDASRLKTAVDTPALLSPIQAITTSVVTQSTTAGYEWRSPALDTQEAGLGRKLTSILGDKIQLQMGHSIQRANIRLDPPNLGLIEIQIIIEGDKTKVQLFSANALVRDVMLQNIDLLRSQLAQKLGMDTSVEVGSESPGEREQKQSMEQAHAIIAGEHEEGEMLVQLKQQSGWINRLI